MSWSLGSFQIYAIYKCIPTENGGYEEVFQSFAIHNGNLFIKYASSYEEALNIVYELVKQENNKRKHNHPEPK